MARRKGIGQQVEEQVAVIRPSEEPATIREIERHIKDALELATQGAFRIGSLLLQSKSLLEHGEWTEWVDQKLPFGIRSAQMYMAIAADERLKAKHVSCLPSSWGTLYELTKLDDDEWEVLEASLTSDLERADIKRLLADQRKRRPKPELPDGSYAVIYADPPWHYDYAPGPKRSPDSHYATMSMDEIAALDIPAAGNCVLFLWATAPLIRQALDVMDAWGFEYKSQACWDKGVLGMGYWFRGEHELLLVGVRGDVSPPDESVRRSSMIRVKRSRKHSEKPAEVYELIESYFPLNTKKPTHLEMFARNKRAGWDSFGDE